MPAGYSGTPLAKKLGIKDSFKIYIHNRPTVYFDLFSDLPENLEIMDGMDVGNIDFIHLFCTSFSELEGISSLAKGALKKDGLIWVSWPKGSSKIPTDLKRDIIREHMLDIGLVDVKVAAIDEDWSGLKFVYRLKDRI